MNEKTFTTTTTTTLYDCHCEQDNGSLPDIIKPQGIALIDSWLCNNNPDCISSAELFESLKEYIVKED